MINETIYCFTPLDLTQHPQPPTVIKHIAHEMTIKIQKLKKSEIVNECNLLAYICTHIQKYLCTVMNRVILQDGVELQCAREGERTGDKY